MAVIHSHNNTTAMSASSDFALGHQQLHHNFRSAPIRGCHASFISQDNASSQSYPDGKPLVLTHLINSLQSTGGFCEQAVSFPFLFLQPNSMSLNITPHFVVSLFAAREDSCIVSKLERHTWKVWHELCYPFKSPLNI
jgi:hypothetical protein